MLEPEKDESFPLNGKPKDYPEEWTENARNGRVRLRSIT
jgi:hypothetical protein